MKLAVIALAALAIWGCSPGDGVQRTPTAPGPVVPSAPTPVSSSSVSGMVIENSGACVVGAKVEIVSGQGVGKSTIQMSPCGIWDYDGGFVFSDLTPNVELTVRASASGYATHEQTVRPSSQTVFLTLSKIE